MILDFGRNRPIESYDSAQNDDWMTWKADGRLRTVEFMDRYGRL